MEIPMLYMNDVFGYTLAVGDRVAYVQAETLRTGKIIRLCATRAVIHERLADETLALTDVLRTPSRICILRDDVTLLKDGSGYSTKNPRYPSYTWRPIKGSAA